MFQFQSVSDLQLRRTVIGPQAKMHMWGLKRMQAGLYLANRCFQNWSRGS